MSAHNFRLPATGLALTTALAIGAAPTHAQQEQEEEVPSIEEVIVEAPWRAEREVVGRTSTGANIEEITLSRPVSYSDLDLTQHADVMELESRIDQVAQDSCERLAEMFPLDVQSADTRMCVDDAKDGAMAQAQEAIAAAGGRADQDVATAPDGESPR